MHILQSKTVADQVDEILLERLREGLYPAGSRMPSEIELSDELGVSRATVRTALAKLAINGLIIRKQGDGTYVNARVREVSAHSGNLWDLAELIISNGYKPTIQPIMIEKRSASEKESLALALQPGDDLLFMRRLFLADGKPAILANNFTPFSLLHEPMESIDGMLHIRDIFLRYCRQKIGFAITDIHSRVIGKETHELLGGDPYRTVLELQVAFYARDNTPLALGINYFDDSFLHLSLVQAWN